MKIDRSKKFVYFSQYGQDEYLGKTFFPQLDDGFFIEVGADDGVDKSNTLFFEKKGWKGICVEPSPTRFKRLENNRSCLCFNNAIHSHSGKMDFLDIDGYGKGLSGIVESYDPRHLNRIKQETSGNKNTGYVKNIEVECRPLGDILREVGVKHVDYISIDVEGNELAVLQSIDFDEVTFDVFSIENNYEDLSIRRFLEGKGYVLFTRLEIDDIYVSPKVLPPKKNLFLRLLTCFK